MRQFKLFAAGLALVAFSFLIWAPSKEVEAGLGDPPELFSVALTKVNPILQTGSAGYDMH